MTTRKVPRYPAPPPNERNERDMKFIPGAAPPQARCEHGAPLRLTDRGIYYDGCDEQRAAAAPPQEGRTAPPEIEQALEVYEDNLVSRSAVEPHEEDAQVIANLRSALLSAVVRALAERDGALRELCDAIGEEDLERAQAACDCASEAAHDRVGRALDRARALAAASGGDNHV